VSADPAADGAPHPRPAPSALHLPPLPPQPEGVPWPTASWPTGPAPDDDAFHREAEGLFALPAAEGITRALLVVQGGRLVFERYAHDTEADTTLQSWSMAKSMTHAAVGLRVGAGTLDPAAPAPVPAWQAPGDPRRGITLDQLLEMRSGLAFEEEYTDAAVSDTIEMLWGTGRDDVAAYAAGKTLEHEPGARFSYSSGTTNIVCAILRDDVGGGAAGTDRLLRRALFEPLGMRSPVPKYDAAGTWKGSSYCFCTARDFARFGLLYLRDGVWEGRRLLPEGWVDHGRTPTFLDPEQGYGRHWWVTPEQDAFYASGHECQRILIDPERDALVVRLGITPQDGGPAVHERVRRLLRTLPRRT
jgi:CubicO group peptidase (beta-lactamase class C family)